MAGKRGEREFVPTMPQLLKHPLAFVALVPKEGALFAAGAIVGAAAKSVTAPLDRTKLLMQIDREDYCEGPKFKNLYVKNLDEDVTEDLLWVKFSDYGNICSVAVMKDNEGKSNGFGFVKFESNEEAKKAILRS